MHSDDGGNYSEGSICITDNNDARHQSDTLFTSASHQHMEDRRRNRARDDPPTSDEVARGLQLLQPGSNKKISGLRKALLLHLCKLKNIAVPDKCTAAELIGRLEEWVSPQLVNAIKLIFYLLSV